MRPYTDDFMDHFDSPRNAGQMDAPDLIGRASLRGRAPYTTLQLRVRGKHIVDARFLTFGCGAMIASCSVLTEMIKGRSLDDCADITTSHVVEVLGGLPRNKQFCPGIVISALHDALKDDDDDDT